jgi:predicted aldo/keto reductase-like oxidoreductase
MKKKKMSRRGFMGGSMAALTGLGLSRCARLFGQATDSNTNGPQIKEYRTLGRTGFKCSDIGFGSSGVTDPAFIGAILDAGVNYVDCAEGYLRGQVEKAIGDAMLNRDRKKVFLTTKLALRKDDTKQSVLERANKCLGRLQSDYIDCLMIHMPSTVAALNNEAYHAAIKDLKARNTLAAYKATYGEFYCRHACGECEPNCPYAVPVNTIMRYNHYFAGQSKEKAAMLEYAALPTNKADVCSNCEGHCEQVCPYGVPVQGLLMLAHRTLTLA